MRLTSFEITKIKEIVHRYVPKALVYIFGSRVDDSKKGGDIDILIIDDEKVNLDLKLEIIVDLNLEIAEQKYDVVSFDYSDDNPFKSYVLDHAILI